MADTGISVSLEALQAKKGEIDVIDEKLDSVSAPSGQQRSVANSIASETETVWKKSVDGVVAGIQKNAADDMNTLVGTVTGLKRAIDEAFKAKIDEYLAKEVEARKSDGPSVSEAEVVELTEQRKTLVGQFRALRLILDQFGQDTSGVSDPKTRRGSRGKRGPRVLTNFAYSIDGKERSATQNTLSSIANTVCSDMGWKTLDLKNWLVEKGLDLQNPPSKWSYTLPNGKVLSAVQVETDEDEEEIEEDE